MSENLELHIVSFTIPYPPNYGGVIDVFYKVKALYELGVKINLHCFQYDRNEATELETICKNVYYYQRPKKLTHFFSHIPFIVLSRNNKKLLGRLNEDNHPILFEGLHTSYFIKELLDNNREIVVRTHNIEHEYYAHLYKSERNLFKKLFFYAESKKLSKYERILKSKIQIATISKNDYQYFKQKNTSSYLIEAFHPFNNLNILEGTGDYVLFHGNLSVHENIETAYFILDTISKNLDIDFIIAGKDPSRKLIRQCKKHKNVQLIENPNNEELQSLIQNAHIHLLTTNQPTGIKLKLINALYNGRHCITNSNMVDGTGLETLCHIHNTPEEIIQKIKILLDKPFNKDEVNKRKEILLKNVNNKLGAQKLINLLYKK